MYDHSLNAEIHFMPGVSVDAAILALKPLADSRGWTSENILAKNLSNDDKVALIAEGEVIQHLSLYTCGDASHLFASHVEAFAEKLKEIAEPGFIELHDHDTGDVANAITTYWYGDPIEVAQAQRLHAWHASAARLRDVGIPPTVLAAMASIGGFSAIRPAAESNAIDPDGARLFWQELLESAESLTAIADLHGLRTLADLFYLQNAVLSCGFIDHYPGESKVLGLASALPSGAKWKTYIKVEYMGSPDASLDQVCNQA